MKKTQIVICPIIRQDKTEIEKECLLCGGKCYTSGEGREEGETNYHPLRHYHNNKYLCLGCAARISRIVEAAEKEAEKGEFNN